MSVSSGRIREANQIRQANRAAAVGQLMLGRIDSWQAFLDVEVIDLESLPRRNLKAALLDIRERLSKEINKFCKKNFVEMDEKKLSLLYEEIKAYRGLELPLFEFEKRFSKINPSVLKGSPSHLTVSISLWGLQYKFPEDELSKDLVSSLQLANEIQVELDRYHGKSQPDLVKSRVEISLLTRRYILVVRSAILCSFNLLEAYLNGLAWDFVQSQNTSNLSITQRKLLEDTTSVSIRDKLKKYPLILSGKELWDDNDQDLLAYIDGVKPFRDSLVHASPFSAPEKFGGYDKLRLFYRLDYDIALEAASLLICIIKRIHKHIFPSTVLLPEWISELESEIIHLDR